VVELWHPEPLVELRLFGSVPFGMAMIVLFLTTMTFRGTGPMISVMQQRFLHFEPLLVAWTQMVPNLVYGGMVLLVGRMSDRIPCHVLVIAGLLVYAAGFWAYAGLNEITTVAMIMPFLMIRFTAEAFIGSPNNLATLEALPENKVYMATALSGLLRSIAATMGTAVATVVLDQRYNYRIQQFAEDTPMDAAGFNAALSGVQQTLRWSGEVVAQIPTQTMALMQDRLLAEATTAAWQDYFVFNAFLALLCVFPALPFWRRKKYRTPEPPQPTVAAAQRPAVSHGVAVPQAAQRDQLSRT
jgi:MFS family permease